MLIFCCLVGPELVGLMVQTLYIVQNYFYIFRPVLMQKGCVGCLDIIIRYVCGSFVFFALIFNLE